jgi:hypothetical protein
MPTETIMGMTQRHVRESEVRIARQRVLIERLRAQGLETSAFEHALHLYENLQEIYVRRLTLLRERAVLGSPGAEALEALLHAPLQQPAPASE